ncbi:MAG: hypothetical protein RIG77_10615 [Cyclobacteriaceae bacterium]
MIDMIGGGVASKGQDVQSSLSGFTHLLHAVRALPQHRVPFQAQLVD